MHLKISSMELLPNVGSMMFVTVPSVQFFQIALSSKHEKKTIPVVSVDGVNRSDGDGSSSGGGESTEGSKNWYNSYLMLQLAETNQACTAQKHISSRTLHRIYLQLHTYVKNHLKKP